MYSPKLNPVNSATNTIDEFLGYNHNLKIADNEFFDMKNMAGEDYPLLATRRKRGIVKTLGNPQGLICRGALCYVDGASLFINNEKVTGLILSTQPDDCPKQLVAIGAYICIFPDKMYVNTVDLSDCGYMEDCFCPTSGTAVLAPCTSDGGAITPTSSAVAPANPSNGDYWLDTSGKTHVLKVWYSSISGWLSVPTSYVKFTCSGVGEHFAIDDCVSFKNTGLSDIDGMHLIIDKGPDYLIIQGTLEQQQTISAGFTVERRVPKMDFVVECNNRLWGCYCGPSDSGVLNELYCCKLGDFKNWRYYTGTALDAYSVSLGSDGYFTGAVSYQNTPVFFKENQIHHVYGKTPSSFTLTSFQCSGVQQGSAKSVQVIGSEVLYKGTDGFYVYNGALPSLCSAALGKKLYYKAVSGVVGDLYYTSLADEKGDYTLLAYNFRNGLWHKEDELQVLDFCRVGNELYAVDQNKNLLALRGSAGTDEKDFPWMIETAPIGYMQPNRQSVKKLFVRLWLQKGAYADVKLQFDFGPWEQIGTVNGADTVQNIELPMVPRRCDRFKLKISGNGPCKIYAMTFKIEKGSET